MDFYQMLMAQMAKDAQAAESKPVPGTALADYGRQFLNILNPPADPAGPLVSQPPLPLMDLTQPMGMPDISAQGLNVPPQAMDYVTKALPFGAGAGLPLAHDIYNRFQSEDASAGVKQPPPLEAIIREANNGRPTAAANDPLTHTFDLGSLPPESMFQLALGGGGGGNVMGDYARLAQQLPQANRVERQVAPPTDFSAADAAMAAAKPGAYEPDGGLGQVLQGMARAGLSGMGGDTGDFLLALGLGAVGGLGSGMDLDRERKDLAAERERQYQLTNAGYQSDKATTSRSQQQQGFDARYESDVNYNAEQAMRQQNVVNTLTHGLDQQNIDRRENTNNAIQIGLHNQQMALERWKMSQPSVEANSMGIVTTATDPKTGKRTMTIDNSPWVQKLQMQAMMRQMGPLMGLNGAGMPGLDFGDNAEVDAPELVKRLSTYYFMNPMAAEQDLGGEFVKNSQRTVTMNAGDNEKLIPQMAGNNIYAYIAPIIADPSHPLHKAILNRMAQMQGMF